MGSAEAVATQGQRSARQRRRAHRKTRIIHSALLRRDEVQLQGERNTEKTHVELVEIAAFGSLFVHLIVYTTHLLN